MKRNTWNNREAVLGVTGSIAAYKACELASRMVEFGIKVIPVLTHSAAQLVGPATFEAITGQRAVTSMFESQQNPDVEHISVATRADIFIIAPATANILAKAAHGMADDWLSTALLATRAPVLFAPAMNTNMYAHPATQANLATLRARGAHFVGPDAGRLACRTVGPGRLIDPAAILETAQALMYSKKDLRGKRVLLTSGSTREPLDPVRFISNWSSGRMGRALAFEAMARGATVTVVAGPLETTLPHGVDVVNVETAGEMAEAVRARLPDCDAFVACAAVADYRPESAGEGKHKRADGPPEIRLVENPDILAEAGANRRDGQVIAGFAAETNDLAAGAEDKLTRKHADIIVGNRVGSGESGFGSGQVEAVFAERGAGVRSLGLIEKDELAEHLFDRIAACLASALVES